MLNIIPIWPVVSEKIFYNNYIRETGPAPWNPCFYRYHYEFQKLARGSSKYYFYQISLKSGQWFQRRKCFKFPIQIILGKLAPSPGGHVFLDIIMNFRNLQEGHLSMLIIIRIWPVVSEQKIFKDFYIDLKTIYANYQWFQSRRFLKFSIKIYKELAPPPGGHVFIEISS